jgi:sigma-B regulation protein RsbU (phosphoserine phosphatase)
VDYVSKPFNAHELLARINTHLTMDLLRRNLAKAQQRELDMAFKVQSQLIPARLPRLPGWDFAARWDPAKEVSGDYYDFIPGKEKLAIVVADVSGKGMPAALMMASTRSIIRAEAAASLGPSEILGEANKLLCADAALGMFVTLFYAEVSPVHPGLTYASCGHNPPYWYRADRKEIAELDPTGPVLAINEDIQYPTKRIEAGPGDVFFFYTDGYTEAFNGQQKFFGDDRLKDVLNRHAGESPQQMLDAVERELGAFVGGAPQSDDRTIVIAKRV